MAIFNENDYIEKSYFNTPSFQQKVGNFTEYFHAFEILQPLKEEMKKEITVTENEIEEWLNKNEGMSEQISAIEQQYQSRINEAEAMNDQKLVESFQIERDKKIDEIIQSFNNEEYIKEGIVKEKEKKLDEYFKELEGYQREYKTYEEAFVYYLKNTETGEIYTNLPTKNSKLVDQYINEQNMYDILSYPSKSHGYLELLDPPLHYQYEDIMELTKVFSNNVFEGKIGISKDTPSSNSIMLDYQNYGKERIIFWIYTLVAIISLIISGLIGKKRRLFMKIGPTKWQSKYNKIPLDLAVLLLIFFSFITIVLLQEADYIYANFHTDDVLITLFWLSFLIGGTMIQSIYMFTRLKTIPSYRETWKQTLIAKIERMFRNAFLNRRVGTQVFLILAIVFLLGISLGLGGMEEGFLIVFFLAFVVIGIPLFIMVLRKTGYFNQILINAKALANGEFEDDLPIKGKSVFAKLAGDINQMKHGVKISQKEQAKSERLKTELITNVSHDLRTPLTSIITYTELLKNPTIVEDDRNAYLEVIDRKSKRLKVLIDDLFEVSKMASGSIELHKEQVDIVQLLQQSLAEYNESIQDSLIQFRITNPEHPVFSNVDGQKLWRVFDNVIGNMVKYSLGHTRAYIKITEEKNQIIITFKNISKYELSENTDELFERFKRGDESRHTDGSGLGLAIAKSIIDLHEGTLDIDVEADLFKVTIVLKGIKQ